MTEKHSKHIMAIDWMREVKRCGYNAHNLSFCVLNEYDVRLRERIATKVIELGV